jgi:hypothetical protein
MVSAQNPWISADPWIAKKRAVREAKKVNAKIMEKRRKTMGKKITTGGIFGRAQRVLSYQEL